MVAKTRGPSVLTPAEFQQRHGRRILCQYALARQASAEDQTKFEIWTLTDEDTVIRGVRVVDSSGYYVVAKRARSLPVPRCSSTNHYHAHCRPHRGYKSGTWRCPRCRRWFCMAEGDDTSPVCDDCWSVVTRRGKRGVPKKWAWP